MKGAEQRVCEVVERFGLAPLDGEGGWFRRVAEGPALPDGRRRWTTILALFTPRQFSALHRLGVDEVWSCVDGDPFELLLLSEDEAGRLLRLGASQPVAAVPAGVWQGGRPRGVHGWSLVSCTCVPGFEWSDLELADRGLLTAAFPQWRRLIGELTRH